MPLLARAPRSSLPAIAAVRPSHRSPRASAPTILLALFVAATLAACTPAGGAPATPPRGTPGAPAASAGAMPSGTASAGCDTGEFPGWPAPGHVTTSGIIPVLASSEKLAGPSRLLFVLVDSQNRPIADESLQVEISFYDLCADPATATDVVTPSFEWGIVGERAFYVAKTDLAQPGPWGASIAVTDPATGTSTEAKLQFSVSEGGFGPRVGDPAPAVKTLTLADVGDVRKVSSDPNPEPTFYETSLDAALAAKEPFLLAFITPAFCKSAQCGPTMEVVKAAVKDAPIKVVAVEPYQLVYQDGRLQPVLQDGNFVPVEAAQAYGIPTEPWIFLVGADGTIASSFEAVVGEQELADAIRAVTK